MSTTFDSYYKELKWLDGNDNAYGVRCLDCREFSSSLASVTQDPAIAKRFFASRHLTGQPIQIEEPRVAVCAQCSLRYPYEGRLTEGPLFMSEVMEDKWDVFLHGGHLYFLRSWTGEVFLKAQVHCDGREIHITSVEASEKNASKEVGFIVRQVDFLVKTYLLKWSVPHPLPSDLPKDPFSIAYYSFSRYGQRACFATFDDTTGIFIEK